MEGKQHLAVFITWFIGLTVILTLVLLVLSTGFVPQEITQDMIWLAILDAIPWGFVLAVVTYPCAYCYTKDGS
ncbi:MAG: hypothetical protein ACTSU3_00475 [Candidatus Thorarchaeota archaeon]